MKIDWSTLWLFPTMSDCRYRPRAASDLRLLPVPEEDYPALIDLYKRLHDLPDQARIPAGAHTWCRSQRTMTVDGPCYVLALLPRARTLSELGVPAVTQQALLAENLRGLVLIAGKQGAGKTTLAGAVVQERVRLYGGSARVIEDPPEMEIHEVMEHGLIQQIDAASAPADIPSRERLAWFARSSVRSRADLLFLGEVRDASEASAVVLQSGIGGPVITTIHADSVDTAIDRLIALAARDMGTEGAASHVAAHLSLVLHRTLSSRRIESHPRPALAGQGREDGLMVLSVRALSIAPDDRALRSAVRRHDSATIRQATESQSANHLYRTAF